MNAKRPSLKDFKDPSYLGFTRQSSLKDPQDNTYVKYKQLVMAKYRCQD